MEPTDLITTLWYQVQEVGDDEEQITVHESSFYAYLPESSAGATAPAAGAPWQPWFRRPGLDQPSKEDQRPDPNILLLSQVE